MKELKQVMKQYLNDINSSFEKAQLIAFAIAEQLGEGRFSVPKEKRFYTHCDCHREKILAIEVKSGSLILWAEIMRYNVDTLPFWEQWEVISKLYDIFAVGVDPKDLE